MSVMLTLSASWRYFAFVFALVGLLSGSARLVAEEIGDDELPHQSAAANPTPAAIPAPASPSGPLRPQDQFWVVGTRHLDCVTTATLPPELSLLRYDCQAGWKNETLSAFVADASRAITVIYIPGNRVSNEEAVSRGWKLYHSLVAASDEEPLRLVVWSWPSDKVSHSLGKRDFQVKAARTPSESYYLGWLLNQFDPAAKISLIGFSYGSRIITGALHLAAGGDLYGVRLPGDASAYADRRVRVVLMAAAVHNYWLNPGEFHGLAFSQIDRLLLLYNTADVALKHYHLAEPDGDPRALGYSGLPCGRLGPDAARVSQRDVRHEIGKQHAELKYYASGSVVHDLQRYALWGPIGQ